MYASERPEVARQADHVKGRRGDPSVGAAPQEACSHEQTPPGDPGEPFAPDEGAVETFVDGSGI
jgi:hypothetical protein